MLGAKVRVGVGHGKAGKEVSGSKTGNKSELQWSAQAILGMVRMKIFFFIQKTKEGQKSIVIS